MAREKQAPTGPFDSFELTLSDVYLLTTQAGREVVVPGLKVVVDQLGLTVLKPDGEVGAVLAWGKLRTIGTGERMQTPSGTPAVVVEATSDIRSHRFAVPTDDPEGLEAVVAELGSAGASVQRTATSAERPRWWKREKKPAEAPSERAGGQVPSIPPLEPPRQMGPEPSLAAPAAPIVQKPEPMPEKTDNPVPWYKREIKLGRKR